jgi:hypothetical protein
MINFKQMELSHQLFDQLKGQFPEIELVDTIESPFSRESLWVRILMPEDEDREIEMGELAAEISTDILLDYGYHITISTAERLATTV